MIVEAKDELEKIKKTEPEINKADLICKIGNKKKSKTHDFQKFRTIRSFEMRNLVLLH